MQFLKHAFNNLQNDLQSEFPHFSVFDADYITLYFHTILRITLFEFLKSPLYYLLVVHFYRKYVLSKLHSNISLIGLDISAALSCVLSCLVA